MFLRYFAFPLAAMLISLGAFGAVMISDEPAAAARAEISWAKVEAEFRNRAEFAAAIGDTIEALTPTASELAAKIRAARAAVLALAPNPETPRSRSLFQRFMKTQDGLSDHLGLALDLLRLYPDKARSEPVRKVFDELEIKETHIVVARSDYVAQARLHNQALTDPPASWIVSWRFPAAKRFITLFEAEKSAPS